MRNHAIIALLIFALASFIYTYVRRTAVAEVPVSSPAVQPAADKVGLIQVRGNVRVSLLGAYRGVTYLQRKGDQVVDSYGDARVEFIQVVFMVEKRGAVKGGHGGMKIISDGKEVKFPLKRTAVIGYEPAESLVAGYGPFALPKLTDEEAANAEIRACSWADPQGKLGKLVAVEATFYGEQFKYPVSPIENVEPALTPGK